MKLTDPYKKIWPFSYPLSNVNFFRLALTKYAEKVLSGLNSIWTRDKEIYLRQLEPLEQPPQGSFPCKGSSQRIVRGYLAAGRQESFGRMPVDAFDVGPVSSKDALLVAGEEVPDPDGAVVGTGREFLDGENEHPLKSGLSCCTFSLFCISPKSVLIHS